jgi:predicted O-methyltransferase YrrM
MKLERIDVAATTPGWLSAEEGECLRRWSLTTPGPYLELGSYCGKSTVWLGDAAESRGTQLFTVDWHRGSPEIDSKHDSLVGLRTTLTRAELLDSVIPIIGSTSQVATHWTTPVSFCFIDACHDEQVVVDVGEWEWAVTDVLAFHDSNLPHVEKAIRMARERYAWRPAERVGMTTVLVR